jgi:hypothetical protein
MSAPSTASLPAAIPESIHVPGGGSDSIGRLTAPITHLIEPAAKIEVQVIAAVA